MRFLWVKTDLLYPLDRGGRIRSHGILSALKADHHITYVALDDGVGSKQLDAAEVYSHAVYLAPHVLPPRKSLRFYLALLQNVFSRLPYALARYQSKALGQLVADLSAKVDYDVLVCDFLTPWVSLRESSGLPPVVLFEHNVEARIWERHASTTRNPLKRLYFARQAKRMALIEGEAVNAAAHVIAVSSEDADVIRDKYGAARVTHVETGVDTDYFQPATHNLEDREHLVFVGSMDWLPNEEGLRWFVNEVLPLIKKKHPDVRLSIVGRNPGRSIRALATVHSGIRVTGGVEDVRPYLRRATAVIVPLRIGSGTRLKIYEALASGKAIVSTTLGAEGLPVRDNQHVLLADEPGAFCRAVVSLLADRQLRWRLGANGRELVETSFSWERVAQKFADHCSSVALVPLDRHRC